MQASRAILPEESSYVISVTNVYLRLRGKGLMLSPLDEARILSWARSGVPLEAALRGIARTFERYAQEGTVNGRPPQLSGCELQIRKEYARHKKLSIGSAPTPTVPVAAAPPDVAARLAQLCERLAEAGKTETDVRIQEMYRNAYRRLRKSPPLESPSEFVSRVDEKLCDEAYHKLSPEEHATIETRVGQALQRSFSAADPSAREALVQQLRRQEVRKLLGLFRLEL
jgi:hypothetical protein